MFYEFYYNTHNNTLPAQSPDNVIPRKQRIDKLFKQSKISTINIYASNGQLFQSWVTVQMKKFLYWFVQANGILNLFPDLNSEGDKKGGRRSDGKYTIS